MKKFITGLIVIAVVVFVACNSSSEKKAANTDTSKMSTMKQTEMKDTTTVAEIKPSFSNIDAKIAASVKEIVSAYLQIKNGLANDSGRDAADAGKIMAKVFSGVDESLFTADQKKIYDGIADDLQEHAEHIGENAKDIAHQREHFALMSEDVYDLVRSFSAGQTLYRDYCPMYNKDKGGAMWLSETAAIQNPYYGDKMPKCGTVEEKINQ